MAKNKALWTKCIQMVQVIQLFLHLCALSAWTGFHIFWELNPFISILYTQNNFPKQRHFFCPLINEICLTFWKKRPTDFSPHVLYPFFTCLLTGQTGLWAHAQTTVLWKFVERDLVWLMTCKPYFEYESSFLCCNPPGKSGGPVKPLVQSINRSSNVWLVPCKMVHVTVTKLCHPETGPRKAQTETKNNI